MIFRKRVGKLKFSSLFFRYLYEKMNKENAIKEIENGFTNLSDLNALNDEEIKLLIDKHLEKVLLWRGNKRGHYECDIIFKNGMIECYKFISGSKFPKFYDEFGEQINVEVIERLKK